MVSKFANETIDFGKNLQINVVKFSVFYDSSMYSVSKEKAKITLDDLIGSIGGHLHLFIGMSLLSFIELIELVYIVMVVKFSSRQEKTKPGQQTNPEEKVKPETLPNERKNAVTKEEKEDTNQSNDHQLNLIKENSKIGELDTENKHPEIIPTIMVAEV